MAGFGNLHGITRGKNFFSDVDPLNSIDPITSGFTRFPLNGLEDNFALPSPSKGIGLYTARAPLVSKINAEPICRCETYILDGAGWPPPLDHRRRSPSLVLTHSHGRHHREDAWDTRAG